MPLNARLSLSADSSLKMSFLVKLVKASAIFFTPDVSTVLNTSVKAFAIGFTIVKRPLKTLINPSPIAFLRTSTLVNTSLKISFNLAAVSPLMMNFLVKSLKAVVIFARSSGFIISKTSENASLIGFAIAMIPLKAFVRPSPTASLTSLRFAKTFLKTFFTFSAASPLNESPSVNSFRRVVKS